MPDITFDDLMNAKNVAKPETGSGGFFSDMTEDGLMKLGTMALEILNSVKGIQAGGGVIATRPQQEQTVQQKEVNKPMIDVDQIKEALTTVKALKGDIKVTEMIKLLEDNKETVAGFLKKA